MKPRASIVAVFGVLLFLSGVLLGWKVGQPGRHAPVQEPAAPAVRQKDGSLVLERKAATPDLKPPHATPPGGVVERVVSVKVQPRTPKQSGPGLQIGRAHV